MSKMVKNIAIIGNGCAAVECIKALRECGCNDTIHLFSDHSYPVYNPMLTTYYVAGKIDFSKLFPFGTNDELARTFNVRFHTRSPVMTLDTTEKVIVTADGLAVSYDRCLIASGASPVRPPIEGIHSGRVYTMRTVEDAIGLKTALEQKPTRVLVVGASMVGIKLVELFRAAGIDVCLADLATHLFPAAAHPDCAAVLAERLRENGVDLRFGTSLTRLEESGAGLLAYFAGDTMPERVDLAVICIGVRANTAFVDRNCIDTAAGVLVNERMETNVHGVYAAGDVAQGRNLLTGQPQIVGLWSNARYQGRTAGRNMAGEHDVFPGNIPHNITHFMNMDFIGIGDVKNYDKMRKYWDGNHFIQLFWQEGLITGANLVDSYTSSGVIRQALIKGLQQSCVHNQGTMPLVQDLLIRKIIMEVEQA
ncbi:MAG: FAD-dependent pyridine nucleotide-disulfide oxidoreductase [Firmicutes bacterium]|nr:FAD-dependent pyridine nucleotide-disulfide oxidoreductase [Bacillota bacterium]